MSGAAWQAAAQRCANALLDCILTHMNACRQHSMLAAMQYPSNNAGGTKILSATDAARQQSTLATNGYSQKQRGFSLLEVMVAFSIMALSLGLLYRITGSSAQQVGSVQQHEQAMALAAAVLDTVPAVPENGLARNEEAAGFAWAVATRPWPTQYDELGRVPRLHEVQVTVSWSDGERVREFALTSLRPERLPEPGQ